MGFAKFMEDNEQLYIERQINRGSSFMEIVPEPRAAEKSVGIQMKPSLHGARISGFAMMDLS